MKNNIIYNFICIFFISIIFSISNSNTNAEIEDTESATHSDTAAIYDIVDTYNYPGFKIIQFNLGVLSHYSYMLFCNKETIIVDPGRDVFKYLEIAKKEDSIIKGVLLTHSHADFVTGHMEIAARIGCPVYINHKANAVYKHEPLKEGSSIQLNQTTIKVLDTPGHTLDCTTSLVYSPDNKDVPIAMFTGDTLFVGSIGRPDLMGGTISAAELASMAYDTWNNKLSKLDDSIFIFPAHGAGSLCGAHLSDEPNSTIGKERKTNHYLQMKSRSEFIAAILDGLPDAPQYFKHNAEMNRKGPEQINWEEFPEELKPNLDLINPKLHNLVDIRDAKEYAKDHIPNSINIGLRGRLETWVGIMIPWESKLVLTGSSEELKEAVNRLHRVGYKADIISFDKWKRSGLALAKNNLIKPSELYNLMQKGDAPVIVDVRLPQEWMGLRIGMVVNLPINQLDALSSKLDPTKSVVTVCNSAYRSSMAAGVLERNGFKKVSSLDGGSQAWIDTGYPVYGSETKQIKTSTITYPKREINLPSIISPSELKGLLLDLPGTFDMVDIRPPEHFADYNLTGSVNVDITDLINNTSYLVGSGPLIIIDRDGSLSMVVAGLIFNKSKREIKALRGGLQAYWEESDLPSISQSGKPFSIDKNSDKTSPFIPQPLSEQPKQPSEEKPQPPKKKSAGC
jgi:hydroxyacylglutathione hydrolase